jgi:hypothetical protein
VSYGEFYLRNCGYSPLFFVHRVVRSHIRKGVDPVKLLPLKRICGRILHQLFVVVIFNYGFAVYGILVLVLNAEGSCVFIGVFLDLVEVKFCGNGIVHLVLTGAKIDTSPLISYFFNGDSSVKKLGKTENNVLSHTIGKNVCTRVHKD